MNNIEHYKEKLLAELSTLEMELPTVGRKNPENPNDWQGTPGEMDVSTADENELADKIEEFEERSAIELELEKRLNEVKSALEKIEKGGFGICSVCNKEIEADRLEANPAATTCKAHMG